ncbi:MAG TPA: zf-HC2 domain-containing protein [Ktedonobacterales bacterium]|jgi:hypothetical protein
MLSEPEHNWEQRREQLSALLDNELAGAERAELETHLQSCAACRAELESLRRARALLRALPQPALPRSFLLPLEPAAQHASGELAEPLRVGRRPSATPAPTRPARPAPVPLSDARANRLRRSVKVVRWLSTVAAVLGLFLLLGSALSTLSSGGKATTANAPSSYSQNSPTDAGGTALGSATPPPESTQKTTTTQDHATPTEVGPNPAATATAKGSGTNGNATPGTTLQSRNEPGSGGGFSLSTPELGLLLLVVGVVGFVVAAVLRRLWPGANR